MSTSPKARILLLSLAFALPMTACGKESPPAGPEVEVPADTGAIPVVTGPPRLGELAIGDMTPEDARPPGVSEGALEMVRKAFRDPDAFVEVPADDATGCKAAVSVGYAVLKNGRPVLEADAGEARAVIEAEVFCRWEGEIDSFRITMEDARRFGGVDASPWRSRVDEAIAEAAHRAARSLHGQVRMRHASDSQILDALTSSGHDGVLAEACAEAGERRLNAGIPHIVRHTAHESSLVAVRAGAALGLLRDDREEVVRALVKMTSGPNEEKHLVAIHALGDIGGDAAARYLDNLSVSHPNAAMRELARETLRRVRGGDEAAP